jgi:excisionase family DNA binding protein
MVARTSRPVRGDPYDAITLPELPAILTVKEVSKVLRWSEASTYAWLRAGGLKHIRTEGSIRVLKVDLERYLSGRSTAGGNDGSS